ncbi:MAG: DUF1015 domain-containing protein [Acidobacteria bacterium]|nr:DUF1015 domain-containing protein [Acidobacteriota bacterium]
MVMVRPFCALQPTKEHVSEVAAVPYDVVNTEEARILAEGKPFSYLHISRPEIDLPLGTDLYSDEVYQKGLDNFRLIQAQAPLIQEETPSLYLYRLRMGEHTQTGVVGCCSVDEYDNNIIRKHERTRKDKEDDRTRHTINLRAQTGPVFLTYRSQDEINNLVNSLTATKPHFDFVAPDGVVHTVWKIPNFAEFVKAFESVPLLYVADGHHRSASASRARAALKAENPNHNGEEEYNYFLSVIFPADQLKILPYNRVVKDLHGQSDSDFMLAVEKAFTLTNDAPASPVNKGEFSMYINKKWYGLTPKEAIDSTNVIASLDVSILQDRLLAPVLGILDPRTDKRVDFVGGIRGTKELEQLVDSKKAAVAFSLYPTTLDDLMNIADAGEIMPPKSTWFEPKLRSGMLVHLI